ncbi:MAG TPA: hypothetical protein VGS28_04265, partial [Candidatus Saccharimonadales bacterium]|nr:hypothetical protein [Candidatus Saccharimonadales bacterium]
MPLSTKRRTTPAKRSRATGIIKNPKLQRIYLAISLTALLASCLYWAYLGARVQQTNADQLVSSFLFKNLATFHGAYISGQHTFLLKWPLFLLVELFKYSTGIFVGLTMGLVTLTVGLFALVLYRIERRPLIFGTICLALAATLIAIPPEPVAGTLLPVNMAMLTTRNVEYIFYIISLGLLVTASRPLIRSKRLWLSVAILSILVASDRLFLSLSVGGSLLFIAAYTIAKRWDMVRLGLEWLATSFGSSCMGVGIVWLLGQTHTIHIVSGGGVSPYGLISNFRDFA